MDTRRLIEGRWIRWNEARAQAAYAQGYWVRQTLADALQLAAAHTPERVLLVDKDVRLDCAELHRQASALAQAMLVRAKPGSVVSFMLPNWHEAAVIYRFAEGVHGRKSAAGRKGNDWLPVNVADGIGEYQETVGPLSGGRLERLRQIGR